MEENNEWYPAKDEYDPEISKEQWKNFVTDRNVFTEDSLTAFACIQKATLATCTDMAEEFGRTKNFYNNAIWRIGEKVHKLTNCPLSLHPDETERFWSICCLGRKLPNGRIELKIRPELKKAFGETGVLKEIEVMEKLKINKIYSFEDLLAFYKKSFIEHWEDEKYKWVAIKHFQDNWNVDAEHFQTMFENATSKAKNLLDSGMFFPRKMILNFSNEQPERVREMFKNLFDETLDLSERINHFKSESVAIQEEHNKNNPHDIWKNNFQTENSISVYLWLKYPDKYYIYKFSEVKSVAEKLGDYEKFKKGKGIENFFNEKKLYDEIAEKLRKDSEIKTELKDALSDSCWQDTELRTLTIDFGFHVSRYFDDYEKNKKMNDKIASPLVDNLTDLLQHTHNLILHGAPGTGKTFLAKKIAKKMGCSQDEIGFVQFHPSYDYTDFVEGLRPKSQNNGEIGFERKDGVFKEFCKRALLAMNVSSVSDNFEQVWEKVVDYLNEKDFMDIPLLTGKSTFRVELNENGDGLATRTYENGDYKKGEWIQGKSKFYNKEQLYNIYKGLPGIPSRGHDNYRKAVIEYWKKNFGLVEYSVKEKSENESVKPFVFIIDEINRGELSKIFGELFFCIDPGYRGKENGTIKTQYQNLIEKGDEFYDGFFVPENVYIIGTMNDIDRSVDTMDFAFRRRFAFKEIKASENLEMFGKLGEIADEAKTRLKKLNDEISKITELSSPSSYHIGGAYFMKLKDFEGDNNERFKKLWNYHLEGLLKEYLRGTENAEENFEKLRKAYFGSDSVLENNSEEEGKYF